MKLAITPYGLASLVAFGLLYSVYLIGINPASLTGVSRWFALSSFWLHFLVLFLVAALLAQGVRAISAPKPWLGQALVGTGGILITLWLFFDGKVFSLFQIHINRFLIEALLQKDSIGAIGASPVALLASFWPLAIFLLPHLFIRRLSSPVLLVLRTRVLVPLLLAVVALLAADKATYAYFYFKGAPFVFELKNAAPVYPTPHPYHIRKVYGAVLGQGSQVTFMEQLGDRRHHDRSAAASHFHYPPVAPYATALEHPFNIIVVVAESIRAADFNPETAPFLSSLADASISANRHYSTSNSTHLGLFPLFYGINPHFFHDARVGQIPSAPLRLLALSGYELHQSLSFSMEWYDLEHFIYGEQPQTFLADHNDAVDRDQAVTGHVLQLARIKQESGTPYFNFVYYYATHADYAHPPETAVFQPALQGRVNFADPRLRDNREEFLNRYRNSIRFIDSEMERMVRGLKDAGVWDNTILIFTSDHGEEFFEEGRYGHNSSLNHYQTQVPFILHIPGMEPRRIERLTSHTDLIGTLLTVLGAPESFLANIQGHDLLSETEKPIYIGNAHFQRPERFAILTGETKIEVDLARRSVRVHSVTDLEGNSITGQRDTERHVLDLLQQFRAFQE